MNKEDDNLKEILEDSEEERKGEYSEGDEENVLPNDKALDEPEHDVETMEERSVKRKEVHVTLFKKDSTKVDGSMRWKDKKRSRWNVCYCIIRLVCSFGLLTNTLL